VTAVERLARNLGLHEVFLLTNTVEAFFAQLGFDGIPRDDAPGPIRESEQFRALCPASAVVMRKSFAD
jgi:N-acetylglutamate synthase-like GNAT family acetyltransferase